MSEENLQPFNKGNILLDRSEQFVRIRDKDSGAELAKMPASMSDELVMELLEVLNKIFLAGLYRGAELSREQSVPKAALLEVLLQQRHTCGISLGGYSPGNEGKLSMLEVILTETGLQDEFSTLFRETPWNNG